MIRTGQRFAGYELQELVGDGDMGAIYKAREVRLERPVALRIVAADLAADPLTRARLNRELTALASVDHPNVAPVYEAGECEGRLFVATRWVNGLSLSELIRTEGPLTPRRAVRIINQVAGALEATHALGIMHRNVKPSSVLVTPADHAYLTDFGLARRAEDMTGITVQAQLLDSVDYVAPEYLGDGETDARSDIYSLGCVLYAALTGEVPYPRPGAPAKMYAHLSAEPPSAREHRPEVSERLDAVVRRAMAKDPAERQQTAGEFAIETAGAVELSSPLWAMRAHPGAARHLGGGVDGDVDPARHFDGGADWRVDPDLGRHDGERQRHVDHGAPAGGRPRTLDPAWTGLDGDGGEERIEQVDGSPVAVHLRGSTDGSASSGAPERPALSTDGYYEPVYFRRGRRRVRLLWALAIAVFLAAPLALLIALTSHASAATAAGQPVPGLRSPHPSRAFKTLHQGVRATEWCAQRRSGHGGRLHIYPAGGGPQPHG